MGSVGRILGLDKACRLWGVIQHNGGILNSLHKLYKYGNTHIPPLYYMAIM